MGNTGDPRRLKRRGAKYWKSLANQLARENEKLLIANNEFAEANDDLWRENQKLRAVDNWDEDDTIKMTVVPIAPPSPPPQPQFIQRIIEDPNAPMGYIYILSEVRPDGTEVILQRQTPQENGVLIEPVPENWKL